jgi:hypothetical protein
MQSGRLQCRSHMGSMLDRANAAQLPAGEDATEGTRPDVAYAGTSTVPATIIDNVGGGC